MSKKTQMYPFWGLEAHADSHTQPKLGAPSTAIKKLRTQELQTSTAPLTQAQTSEKQSLQIPPHPPAIPRHSKHRGRVPHD